MAKSKQTSDYTSEQVRKLAKDAIKKGKRKIMIAALELAIGLLEKVGTEKKKPVKKAKKKSASKPAKKKVSKAAEKAVKKTVKKAAKKTKKAASKKK